MVALSSNKAERASEQNKHDSFSDPSLGNDSSLKNITKKSCFLGSNLPFASGKPQNEEIMGSGQVEVYGNVHIEIRENPMPVCNRVILSRSELMFYNMPSAPSTALVPRKKLFEEMYNIFSQGLSNRNVKLVLSGSSGMGKTALAHSYFLISKKPYHFRAWFNGKNEESLTKDFVELAQRIGLNLRQRNLIKEVCKWLDCAYSSERCLLVFDGITENAILEDFLPEFGADIIITSQNTYWPGFKTIPIAEMEPNEAIALVKMNIQGEEDTDIEELVQAVGCIPSDIIAATQKISTEGISIKQYLATKGTKFHNLP